MPLALLWTWLSVFVFCVGNQYTPPAILEDKINKPWRPIPAGRLTADQARNLLLGLITLSWAFSFMIGVGQATAAFQLMCYMYNELGGSDVHYVVRNLLNGLSVIAASTGVASVLLGGKASFNQDGWEWVLMLVLMMGTTVQAADLRDQEGDRARDRHTLPLKLGDTFTRWSIVIPTVFWSCYCPAWWSSGVFGYSVSLILGGALCSHILLFKSTAADRKSWKMWGFWTLSLYLLPFSSAL